MSTAEFWLNSFRGTDYGRGCDVHRRQHEADVGGIAASGDGWLVVGRTDR